MRGKGGKEEGRKTMREERKGRKRKEESIKGGRGKEERRE